MAMRQSPYPRARVVKPYTPEPGDPVQIEPGDPLRVGEESPVYPGWLRVTTPSGRTTWMPEAYVRVMNGKGIAQVEYDSRELAVQPGDEVELLLEYRGWVWARTVEGRHGWLPLDVLGPVPESPV